MKILLDECVTKRLKTHLDTFQKHRAYIIEK